MSGAIAVVHEDGEVLAVDKPAGLAVIPARDEPPEASLQRRLELSLGGRLWVVHRLDRDTSGVVAFARSAEAHRRLSLAFEHRLVSKAYLAFAAGALDPGQGRIEVALHAARRGRTRPASPGEPGSQPSATDYLVEREWSRAGRVVSLLEARPLTGRHHQIRVHLRFAGAPVLFDRVYGGAPALLDGAPCRRLALHARRLVVPRGDGTRLVLEAPLPPDLLALSAWLDEGWAAAGPPGPSPPGTSA